MPRRRRRRRQRRRRHRRRGERGSPELGLERARASRVSPRVPSGGACNACSNSSSSSSSSNTGRREPISESRARRVPPERARQSRGAGRGGWSVARHRFRGGGRARCPPRFSLAALFFPRPRRRTERQLRSVTAPLGRGGGGDGGGSARDRGSSRPPSSRRNRGRKGQGCSAPLAESGTVSGDNGTPCVADDSGAVFARAGEE